ncbi:DUF2807 domain-containing protein [Sphingomonas sp. KR1UV-12]|uniref:DUF2807 domain-containing protein n=1 Tax=Sphingomonas aurea TaxID=3063994 RepID=A0ABT9ENS1_9SPHN|nr:DUF2807 domain-containing protein [Sphingomonas sp. KR1UV-12]MDP1028615.1 DUF2807 domain-containing protein [Sphingomonas sp. KR1UV-12]
MRIAPFLALIAVAAPVGAAERTVSVGSFDRVRVDTAVVVRIATGVSPAARITGGQDAVDSIEVRVSGTTLSIRRRTDGWQERPTGNAAEPTIVTLGTGALAAITVNGAAAVTVDRLKGPRVDLSIAGPGRITAGAVDADLALASVIGDGTLAIAGGRARTVRLAAGGAGGIDAGGLVADDLSVRLGGTGDIAAQARYTATVTSAGIGHVTVAGTPKCVIRPAPAGPVACGTGS